ncbi:YibE/F family protein [Candidatus Gracilibacteria bacterium]|nr:YibE/F family protein [Candidatus Gracilibacteria bacterium]
MLKKFLPFIVFLLIGLYLAFASPIQNPIRPVEAKQETIKAEIVAVENESNGIQNLKVKDQTGRIFSVTNDETMVLNPRTFIPGDEVMILTANDGQPYIGDFVREKPLLILLVIFVVLVLLITKTQGFFSLFGMLFSFVVIFQLILPLILSGFSPLLAAIIGATLIIPANFYLSHGLNRKTTVAVIATLITLTISALLAVFFSDFAHLSGTASDEVSFLSLDIAAKIDLKGLLLAGMILSLLGILDDITIAQASIVQQLKGAKNKISFAELFARAMHVGRDHIASLVNTLILVYAGASLPLLLLFLDHSQTLASVINYEFLAEEITRTLIGSIGIVLAVPLTTLLAALVLGKAKPGEAEGSHCCH